MKKDKVEMSCYEVGSLLKSLNSNELKLSELGSPVIFSILELKQELIGINNRIVEGQQRIVEEFKAKVTMHGDSGVEFESSNPMFNKKMTEFLSEKFEIKSKTNHLSDDEFIAFTRFCNINVMTEINRWLKKQKQ